MKIKKYFSVFLILALTVSLLAVPVTAEENDSTLSNNLQAAGTLAALDIIEPHDESEDWNTVSVTKGEFLKTVLAMTYYSEDFQTNVILPWEGYESGTEYYSVYAYAYLNGWLRDGEEIGSPEDVLTYDFAADFMMKLMGYYPELDNALRSEAYGKLVKDTAKNDDGTLSLNGVYTMMYAASQINCYHAETVDGKPGFVIRDGRTILTYYKDIYMIRGRVNATQYVSLNGAKALPGELIINSDEFLIDDSSYEMLLGKTVTGYARIKDGEEAKALYLEAVDGRGSDIVIDGKDFISYSGRQITYQTENGKSRVQTVNNPLIVYNGKQIEGGEYSDDIFDITDGNITLIKNSGDVDVIVINKYKNIIVGVADTDKKLIYDLVYSGVTLDLNTDAAYIKSAGGSDVTISDLKSGNVLTYAQSMDGEYITGTVGGSAMTAKITSKDSGENMTVTIGGKKYSFAAEAEESKATLRIGVEYTFYINVNGRIAAVKGLSAASGEMAYMIKAYSSDTDKDTVKLRVIKPGSADNNDAVELTCRDRVKVDGRTYKNEQIITAVEKFNGTASVPIIYTLTEAGLVSQIDTPYYDESKEDKDTLRIRHNGETDGAVYSKTALGFGYRNLFDGKYIMDFDGMCIQKISESEIAVAEKIRNDSSLKMDIFGIGAETPLVCFAVVNDTSLSAPALETEMAVVQKKYEAENADNSIVTYLTLVIKGEEKNFEILPEKDAVIASRVDSGDLIRYAIDEKNRITDVSVVLDYSDRNSSIGYQNYSFQNNNDYRIVIGKVYDIYKTNNSKAGSNSNIIQFTKNMSDIENNMESIFARSGVVYRYSMEGRGNTKHVEMPELNVNEIKTYKNTGNDADIIVMVSNYSVPTNIYIVSSKD